MWLMWLMRLVLLVRHMLLARHMRLARGLLLAWRVGPAWSPRAAGAAEAAGFRRRPGGPGGAFGHGRLALFPGGQGGMHHGGAVGVVGRVVALGQAQLRCGPVGGGDLLGLVEVLPQHQGHGRAHAYRAGIAVALEHAVQVDHVVQRNAQARGQRAAVMVQAETGLADGLAGQHVGRKRACLRMVQLQQPGLVAGGQLHHMGAGVGLVGVEQRLALGIETEHGRRHQRGACGREFGVGGGHVDAALGQGGKRRQQAAVILAGSVQAGHGKRGGSRGKPSSMPALACPSGTGFLSPVRVDGVVENSGCNLPNPRPARLSTECLKNQRSGERASNKGICGWLRRTPMQGPAAVSKGV